MHGDGLIDDIGDEVECAVAQVVTLEDAAAVVIDGFPLTVEHVVVLEHVLAHLSVAGLNLRLGGTDSARHNLGLDGRVVEAATHERLRHARVEQAHEVVGEREVEAALAGVTLTTRTTAELVVDAAGFVTLGTEDVKTAGSNNLGRFLGNFLLYFLKRRAPCLLVLVRILHGVESLGGECGHRHELGVTTEHDVGTTTGHVRGNGDRAETTSLSHDGGLTSVVLSVQYLVANASLGEQLGEVLALLDRRGSHEDRLTEPVTLLNVVGNALELDDLVLEDEVGVVLAHHRAVGGNRDHTQLVGAHKLAGLGLCRTGHARNLLVHAEVVLQRHGGQSLVLRLNLDALLGLNGLVDALVVTATRKDSTGVLIHDEHFAIHDDIVFVALEQCARLD